MEPSKPVTKSYLVWTAIKSPLRDMSLVAAGFAVFLFAVLFIEKLTDQIPRSVPWILLFSLLYGIVFLFAFCVMLLCCVAPGLALLRRQERALGFSLREEALPRDDTDPNWYIRCELCRVLAVRRGFLAEVGFPKHHFKLLYSVRIRDITGRESRLLGTYSQLNGLKRWADGNIDHSAAADV